MKGILDVNRRFLNKNSKYECKRKLLKEQLILLYVFSLEIIFYNEWLCIPEFVEGLYYTLENYVECLSPRLLSRKRVSPPPPPPPKQQGVAKEGDGD